MEWLKDKKNLPIVIGMAVFVFLAAGGLIGFELGLFGGGGSTPTQSATAIASPGGYPGATGGYPGAPGGYPGGAPGGYPGSARSRPGASRVASAAPAASAVPVIAKPVSADPRIGADPFAIPGSQKQLAKIKNLVVPKTPLSAVLPAMNLYQLHPVMVAAIPPPDLGAIGGATQLADTRVSGIVTAADGIYAVVEVNGNSQTVKPGDSLADGSKVAAIQPTGITLHTPSGESIIVPLSSGAPPPPTNPYGYGSFGGGAGYPGGGFPGGYPGGGFPGGYPGGGYPGGGGFGGGYPGGGGGFGGGYPGGGGGGGYPGGGGFGGGDGGGYPGG
jgi:hypothetical protein